MNGSVATKREVIRCKYCNLNQFRPGNDCCRKCDKPLYDPKPVKEPEVLTIIPPYTAHRRIPVTKYTPTSVLVNFGVILRRVRQELGYTQDESAYIAGIGRSNLTRIEGGFHDPATGTLDKVCRALHISLGDLMFSIETCRSSDDCIITLQLLSLSKFLTMDQIDRIAYKARCMKLSNKYERCRISK